MNKPKYLNISYSGGKYKNWADDAIMKFLEIHYQTGVNSLIVRWDDKFFINSPQTDYVNTLRKQIRKKHPELALERKKPEFGEVGQSSKYMPGKEYVIGFKEVLKGQVNMEDLCKQPTENEESLPVDTTPDELLPVDGETGAEEKTYYDILMEHMDHELALMTDLLATHYCLMNKLIGRIS